MSIMELLFATGNPHKLEEVRSILAPLGIKLLGLDDLDDIPPEPHEDGATFEANARIKAVAYANATQHWCLADDSGLEVDALGGAPGVHSARYARKPGDDPEFDNADRDARDRANNQKLQREIAHVPSQKRSARFVCTMCLADPDGHVKAETHGTFEGRITDEPRGENGFGYDPMLELPDCGCTSAELSPEEKNARSHRGAAAHAMAEKLQELGLIT